MSEIGTYISFNKQPPEAAKHVLYDIGTKVVFVKAVSNLTVLTF